MSSFRNLQNLKSTLLNGKCSLADEPRQSQMAKCALFTCGGKAFARESQANRLKGVQIAVSRLIAKTESHCITS